MLQLSCMTQSISVQFEVTCRTCKNHHHTSLCQSFSVDNQLLPVSSQTASSQTSRSQTTSFQTSSSQTASSQTTSSQTTNSQPKAALQAPADRISGFTTLASTTPTALYTSVCLLKTAIVEVSLYTTIAEGRILFDKGAQRLILHHTRTGSLASSTAIQP